MGAAVLKPLKETPKEFPKLLEETQLFTLWTLDDVKELFKRMRQQIYGYAIVEAQFESIMTFKEGKQPASMDKLFQILDNDDDGRIDGLELLGGLALCCQASFEDRAKFCFELYDFNLSSTISRKEMVMMMMVSICGVNLLTGGGEELEPDLETIETISEEAFLRADRDNTGYLSYDEFVTWARSNRDLMAAMESLNKVTLNAKIDIESDDSASETDEGEFSDVEPAIEHGRCDINSQFNKDKMESSSLSIATAIATRLSQSKSSPMHKGNEFNSIASRGDETSASTQWKGQIFEPTDFKVTIDLRDSIKVIISTALF
jgi:Ca2+-binding EF-hand superfamily protein